MNNWVRVFFVWHKSPINWALLVFLCIWPALVWSASYPENRDYGAQGDFLAKRGTEFGRTADLTPIGPVLINLPEGPGSTSNGVTWRFETTAWDLSDLTNPQFIRSLTCPTCFSGQPMSAHGTIIRLDRELNEAQLFAVDPQFVIYDPNGVDSNAQVVAADRVPDGHIGGMLAPYATAGFWEYGFTPGPLWIRNPRVPFTPSPEFPSDRGAPWLGAFVTKWDHLGLTSVTGFTAFLGELLVVASDQQSTGIAIYDRSGLKDGQTPRLLSTFRPNLTEPDGSPIGIGGYWMEPYGANKIVWAARPRDNAPARDYPAMYVVDFTDPENPRLTCEIYFDQNRSDPADGDGSSDPMYVNFQDQYAYVDHFKVDIEACEQAYAGDQNIDASELAQIVYRFDDIANHCDGSQYFRPLGQVGVFGGHDWWVTDAVVSYTGGTMTNWQWHTRADGAGFNPILTLAPGRAMVSPMIGTGGETVSVQVGDVFTNGLTGQQYTVTNVERDERINEQGMCFMVTSDVADTHAPFVSGHRPLADQTNVPVDTYIHIHIPETLRSETLVSAAQVVRLDENGNELESVVFESQFSHTGTLSIWPNTDLVADASYRVELRGIQDYMGNTMEDYSYVFSTGETVISPPPEPVTPAPTYTGPSYFPNQSSEMSCLPESEDNNLWVVNPDNDTLAIIDSNHAADSFELSAGVVREIALGYQQPSSVTHIDGLYAVTARGDDTVVFFDTEGNEQFSVDTGYGSQPIASVSDGEFLYVSLYGSGEVIKISLATQNIVARLAVGAKPRAMALYEQRLLVARFISTSEHGEVYDINTVGDLSLTRTIRVNKVTVVDDLDHGSGVPNMLSSIVISPDGETAYISAIKANVDRGLFQNGLPLDSDNTVRPMLVILDLVENRDANVDPSTREGTLDFDNAADPSFVTFLADRQHRVTSLRGNNVVLVQNESLNTSAQFITGFAPRSACATLRTLYVKNYTDRSVSAIDVAPYMHDGSRLARTVSIATVANEMLSADELRGLRIFYHSSQPQMGDEGYISCASCHTDGGHDGMTWDLTSLGEGLRNTISLNGSQGTRFGNLHWTSNFDEVQDFEMQIEQLNGGEGLIAGRTFNGQSPLDFASVGRSGDLDALSAYISGLGRDSLQRSPYRTAAGELTEAAQRGEQIFQEQGCATCHSGAAYRDGQQHDVGTITQASGSRLTGQLNGIRTPTLVELWDSAPYFHDGSAENLEEVLNRGAHQVAISNQTRSDLIAFLLSIDNSVFIDDDAEWPESVANRPPVVVNPVADQMTVVGQRYEFVIPPTTFSDPDNDTLTIRAGSLIPGWLSFDSDSLVLSGTPTQTASIEIELLADDGRGGMVSDFFTLAITDSSPSTLDAVDDTVMGQVLADGRIRILISELLLNDSQGQGGLRIPYLDDWINGVAQLNSSAGEIIFTPSGSQNGQFTYALEDASGAIDWAIVTVVVNSQPADTVPPVITIDGYVSGSTITLTVGDRFETPAATARDNVDGAVAVTTAGNVNVNRAGNYTITYSAADAAGNTANASLRVVVLAAQSPPPRPQPQETSERGSLAFIPAIVNLLLLDDGSTPVVLDTEPPVISIEGYSSGDTINLSVGDAFSAPSATATDNVDGAVAVTVSGSVDVNQPGTYAIGYAASDMAGNTANASLNVIVREDPVVLPPNAVDGVRQYTFNHSLWQHNFDNNAVTGYWVGDFANASGTTYAWSGQFGQLSYHSLPPTPALGSMNTLPLWDNEDPNAANYAATFEEVELDNIIIMPDNFTQGDSETVSNTHLNDAFRVIDDMAVRQPDAPIVIYEHWPELVGASFPPTQAQEDSYHVRQLGSYHRWFVNYQNAISQQRPNANVRMIPVGPILSEIFTNSALQTSNMTWEERYDDNDPHGKPSLYFLAGLITYQAMFGQPVADAYVAPTEIDARIRDEFAALNDFVWQRLNFYNSNGVTVW